MREKFDWLLSDFDKELLIKVLYTTYIVGLVAHGYCYLNLIHSHDSIRQLVEPIVFEWTMSIGRFMRPLDILLRGNIAVPWLIGIFSLFWLSLANYLIVKLLDIKERINIFFVCALLTSSYVLTFTNSTYIHDSSAYMLALLCSVLAVYVFDKFKYGYLFTPLLVMCTCALYQAYFAMSLVLFMIVLIKNIIDGKTSKEIIVKSLNIVCLLVVGLVLYKLIFDLVLNITGIDFGGTHNSLENVAKFSIADIPLFFIQTYTNAIYIYTKIPTYYRNTVFVINIIFAVLIFLALVRLVKINKVGRFNILLLFLIMLLFPFAMNIIYFIAKTMAHDLMRFSFFAPYILLIMLLEYNIHVKTNVIVKINRAIVYVCSSLIILSGVIFSNQIYLYKDIIHRNTLSFATLLLDRIYTTPDYHPSMQVAFVGYPPHSIFNTLKPRGFENIVSYGDAGMYDRGASFGGGISITYYEVLEDYFKTFIPSLLKIDSVQAATIKYSHLEEVKAMGTFPSPDSCKVIDDVLVVKLVHYDK